MGRSLICSLFMNLATIYFIFQTTQVKRLLFPVKCAENSAVPCPKLLLLIAYYNQLLRVNINLYFSFFNSLCHNHVIMLVYSESLVNGKNKYSSRDLIRDFTVKTASQSRHV